MKCARYCLPVALLALVPVALAAPNPPVDLFGSQSLRDLFADSSRSVSARENRIIRAFRKSDAPLFYQLLECDLCREHVTSSSALTTTHGRLFHSPCFQLREVGRRQGEHSVMVTQKDVLHRLLQILEENLFILPNLGDRAFKYFANLIVRHIKKVELAILEAASALDDCKDFRLLVESYLQQRSVAVPVCFIDPRHLQQIFTPRFVSLPALNRESIQTVIEAYAGGQVLGIDHGFVVHDSDNYRAYSSLATHQYRREFLNQMESVVEYALPFLPGFSGIPDAVQVIPNPGVPLVSPALHGLAWTDDPAMRASAWLFLLAPALTKDLVDKLESTEPGAHVDNLTIWADLLRNVGRLMETLISSTVHIQGKAISDYENSAAVMGSIFANVERMNDEDVSCIADSDDDEWPDVPGDFDAGNHAGGVGAYVLDTGSRIPFDQRAPAGDVGACVPDTGSHVPFDPRAGPSSSNAGCHIAGGDGGHIPDDADEPHLDEFDDAPPFA